MNSPLQGTLFEMQEGDPKAADPSETYSDYMAATGAQILSRAQMPRISGKSDQFEVIFYKGDPSLLSLPIVSVVGTRSPSEEGRLRAKKVTKSLVELGYVVMSGLAKGIDTIAHSAALEFGGNTIAVMGTPIHKIYPAENKNLAERISNQGLIISPSLPHEEKGRYLFPRRNRLMAMLSIATIIVEAGETSGVVHQAAECLRQGRKLLLLKSLTEAGGPTWTSDFIKSGATILESPGDLSTLLKDA
ncbi:MAG: DNA-protecting protein DprA [Bdellovibrionales bacterium]|nr:DNA-protecting protein DprA [Bdellovibrionales bacterium]